MKVFYDKDSDFSIIKNKIIAIIGYRVKDMLMLQI